MVSDKALVRYYFQSNTRRIQIDLTLVCNITVYIVRHFLTSVGSIYPKANGLRKIRN